MAEKLKLIDQYAVRLLESDPNAYSEKWNADYERGFLDAINKALELPTIEAEPVKQGRWIENSDPGQNINEHYMCSECGCTFHNWANDNYCPNCGSKNRMDGDSE